MTGVQTCALPICFPVTIGGSLSVNDYVQLIWYVSNTNVSLDASAASGSIPAIPSVIFNMQKIN